jgi:glycosyltransferase involved in cell wall biosynthesis
MKVVHVNTFPAGGAAVAAIRLHHELLNKNIDSSFVCISNAPVSIERAVTLPFAHPTLMQRLFNKAGFPLAAGHIRERLLKKYRPDCEYLGLPYSDYPIENLEAVKNADVINLHWTSRILNYPSFFRKIKKPVVWTLHDLSLFMGCFNYPVDQRNNPQMADVDERFLQTKIKVLQQYKHPLHCVAPSEWILEEAKSRARLPFAFHHIPYGIDPAALKMIPMREARSSLQLPQDKTILLFVCDKLETQRKRFDLIQQLARQLPPDRFLCLSIGGGNAVNSDDNIQYAGRIDTLERLNLYYAAADYFLIPSEEDNFPNVVLESLFCGTPVISNNAGGMKDMIRSENGYLIDHFNLDAVTRILESPNVFDRRRISEQARQQYPVDKMANRYIEIFCSVAGT